MLTNINVLKSALKFLNDLCHHTESFPNTLNNSNSKARQNAIFSIFLAVIFLGKSVSVKTTQ